MSTFLGDTRDEDNRCLVCGRNRYECDCTELSEAEWTARVNAPPLLPEGWTYEQSQFGIYHIHDEVGNLAGAGHTLLEAYQEAMWRTGGLA